VSVLAAVALAWTLLHWRATERAPLRDAGASALVALRRLHSGAVTDYVTWVVGVLAVLGAAFSLTLR
jgi:hypothetical protein